MGAVRVFLGTQLLKFHCFNGGNGGQSQRYIFVQNFTEQLNLHLATGFKTVGKSNTISILSNTLARETYNELMHLYKTIKFVQTSIILSLYWVIYCELACTVVRYKYNFV